MYQNYLITLAMVLFPMFLFGIWMLITLKKQPDSNEKHRGLFFAKSSIFLILANVLLNALVFLVAK